MKKKEILIFDEKKFKVGLDHANYSIAYEMFKSDVDTSEMSEKDVENLCGVIEKRTNQACFSNFSSTYSDYFKKTGCKPNRIRFLCEPKKHNKEFTHLSKKEINKWVKLCKKNNVMPDNIGKNFLNNNIYDICFEDISLETCYIYLCSGRYVQEEPYFVRGVLHLVEDHGLGFFTAFCLATYYQTSNTGHHILPFSRDYSASQMPETLNKPMKGGFGHRFNFICVARLANFVQGGDNGKCIKNIKLPLPQVNLHSELSKSWRNISDVNTYVVNRENLMDEDLESVIKSKELNKSAST